MADDIFDRMRAARALRKEADAQVRALVNEAFEAGHTWQEIAECLDVSRARVYQIRNGTR
jgi:DNA-directed RNA polymerase specialized sigma subunit